jgi:DNA (cytosine-5)-methyltransferase 1
LRLFGYPEWYEIPTKEYDAFDLLGNTVVVPVVEFIASRILASMHKSQSFLTIKDSPVYAL